MLQWVCWYYEHKLTQTIWTQWRELAIVGVNKTAMGLAKHENNGTSSASPSVSTWRGSGNLYVI